MDLDQKVFSVTKKQLLNEYTIENKKGGFVLCIPQYSKIEI